MLPSLSLCGVLLLVVRCIAREPTCSDFGSRSANTPDSAEFGTFSEAGELEDCEVLDSARFDKATFQETVTISNSSIDGATILYSHFEKDLVVEKSLWSNVRLEGSRVSGELRIIDSDVHFTDATATELGAVALRGISSQYVAFPASKIGRLSVSDSNIRRFGCSSCIIDELIISDTSIASSTFDTLVASQVSVENSQVRGGFALANFNAESLQLEKSGLFLGENVNLSFSCFDGAMMQNTTITSGAKVLMEHASFRSASLQGSNFTGVLASYSKFVGADIRSVDFSGATLIGADFTDAITDDKTDFAGVITGPLPGDESSPPNELGISAEKACFPGQARVELQNGEVRRMDELVRGDRVRTGPTSFSDVILFTHRLRETTHNFVAIVMESGRTITLSRSHLLYRRGSLVEAGAIQPGDRLESGTGHREERVLFTYPQRLQGLYNPHTQDGKLVVDGIVCSCYTAAVAPRLAHFLLLPDRILYPFKLSLLGKSLEAPGHLLAWSARLRRSKFL